MSQIPAQIDQADRLNQSNPGLPVPTITGEQIALQKTIAILQELAKPTPADMLKSRDGRAGQTWLYVPGVDFIRRMNEVFFMHWSFEVKQSSVYGDQEYIAVLGRLQARLPSGEWVTKEQFGSHVITYNREGRIVDIGDDLKSAATDAFKKCASMLGVYLDTFGEGIDKEPTPRDGPVTPETLNELTRLLRDVYDNRADEKAEELSLWVTKNAVSNIVDLTQGEAEKLLAGLQKQTEKGT